MSDDATGSGSGDPGTLGGASSVPAAGGASGAPAAGGVGLAGRSPNGGAGRLGRLVSGLPLPVHDHETPATGGELDDYLRTAWATDHLDPGGDPHAQYVTAAEVPPGVDAYTKAQSDARYEPLDSAYTKAEADARYLTAAGADALFLTPAEGALAFAAVDHTHPQVTTGQYHFQTNPAMTDPGTGNFRSNTGAAKTATALAMDQIGAGGTDIATLFQAMRLNDTIFVQDQNDAAQWVRYQLTAAPTLNAGWAQVPVAVIASGGTIAGTQLCVMQLTLTAGGGGGGGAGVVGSDPLWDAKGDLVAGTGADAAARLAVGTNGQILTADSAQATGLAWATRTTLAHDHTTADGSGVLSNDEHDGFSQYVNLGADPSTPAANRIRLYSKDNGSGVSTLYYRSEDGAVYELPTLPTGGGGGSGAPANATYVTLAAEAKLSAETALGAGVIMQGLLAARPAFGTAGRLYLATDTDLVYRDTGSAWGTFATRAAGGAGLAADPLANAKGDVFAASGNDAVGRLPLGADGQVLTADSTQTLGVKWAAAGGGAFVDEAGDTMTGLLTLQGASGTTNVLQAKTSGDTQPRLRVNTNGLLEWGAGGGSAPDVAFGRTAGATFTLTGSLRTDVTNTRSLGGGESNRFNALYVTDLNINPTTATSATAGAATALPAAPQGYVVITIGGVSRKVAFYAT